MSGKHTEVARLEKSFVCDSLQTRSHLYVPQSKRKTIAAAALQSSGGFTIIRGALRRGIDREDPAVY